MFSMIYVHFRDSLDGNADAVGKITGSRLSRQPLLAAGCNIYALIDFTSDIGYLL